MQGASDLLLVFANPPGNAETSDQSVELRLAGGTIGRNRVRGIAAGQQERLLVHFVLPPGTRGPVDLEVWVGGGSLGRARVTPLSRTR
jgi:hypothetical protein